MGSLAVLKSYEKIKEDIRSYGKVAVAFSGGVDSSLLLFAAGEALARENVIALHGRSCFNCKESPVEDLYCNVFSKYAKLKIFELTPLAWPEFNTATEKRCYYCKRRIYSLFIDYLKTKGSYVLLDGTNVDDLNEHRPGLAVLQEFSIKTPFVSADICKKDVRFLAAYFGLPNHETPSNSCFATRLNKDTSISEEDLEIVEKIESRLKNWGYIGCRARPDQKRLIIEIREQDFTSFSHKYNRMRLVSYCRDLGFETILLDIRGR